MYLIEHIRGVVAPLKGVYIYFVWLIYQHAQEAPGRFLRQRPGRTACWHMYDAAHGGQLPQGYFLLDNGKNDRKIETLKAAFFRPGQR